MLLKTRGIVLKSVDYTDNSIVVQLFTLDVGLQSYLVSGVRKAKSRIGQALFSPFSLLEVVVYHKPNGGVQRLSDAKQAPILQSIPFDVVKRSMVLFLHEVLCKSLPRDTPDEPLFNYIFNAIEWLDYDISHDAANFHLKFLAGMTKFLGFMPAILQYSSETICFDLRQGVFLNTLPQHSDYIGDKNQLYQWKIIFNTSINTPLPIKLNAKQRQELLVHVLNYYRLHLSNFGVIKSLAILQEIFN